MMLAYRSRHRLLHGAHRACRIRRLYNRGTADDHVRACIRTRIDRVQANTAIHLNIQINKCLPQCSNLFEREKITLNQNFCYRKFFSALDLHKYLG